MTEEERQAWQDTAERDRAAADLLRNAGLYALAVFHLQQAAEKALKARCALTERPAFTHSLVMLLRKLRSEGDAVGEPLFAAARRLDVHYTQSRYPGGLGVAPEDLYDEDVCRECERCADEIIEFSRSPRRTSRD